MEEWGIFNDEAADYTADEAVEDNFWSKEEAERAILSRYNPEDCLHAHQIEPEDDEDEEDEEDDEDEEDEEDDEDEEDEEDDEDENPTYPVKY